MNGSEHYAAGERLLARIEEEGESVIPAQRTALASLAQAHFLAAQTAATLFRSVPGDVNAGWADALGHVSKPPPADPWSTPVPDGPHK